MKLLTSKHIQTIFKPRRENSHKGTHGHVCLVVGEKGKMGAAVISAKACLRSGAGLVSVLIPEEERFIIQTALPEAMVIMRSEKTALSGDFSAIGIGCGLGTDAKAKKLLREILHNTTAPLVLDADALNIIAANPQLFSKIPANSILTPHPKEFDRLFGEHVGEKTEEKRQKTAIFQAQKNNWAIVLKGHRTLITNGKEHFFNTTGNAGLAKGGSGDALTGIISAFLAQGYEPFSAAKLGVYIHGLAADICLQNQSKESMLITDVLECLGKAFQHIEDKIS